MSGRQFNRDIHFLNYKRLISYELFIAVKYFFARKQTGSISFHSFISLFGVTLGVTALLLVLFVMSGLESEIIRGIFNGDSHLWLQYENERPIETGKIDGLIKKIYEHPKVIGASPTIFNQGLIKSDKSRSPSAIKAVDINSINSVINLESCIIHGELNFAKKEINGKYFPGIILGKYLADRLLALETNSLIRLVVSPESASIFTGPNVMEFYVAGLVEFGYPEYDSFLSFISLSDAMDLFDMKKSVSRIEIRIDDFNDSDAVAEEIENGLKKEFIVKSWSERYKTLFKWMNIEQYIAYVLLSLTIFVASFNIINSMIMMVMEKTAEIGILKSMGATRNSIMLIFLYQGLIIGVIGSVIGSALGYLIGYLQIKCKLISFPKETFIIDALPIQMYLSQFIAVVILCIIICLLASTLPAYRASRLYPIEAIRFK